MTVPTLLLYDLEKYWQSVLGKLEGARALRGTVGIECEEWNCIRNLPISQKEPNHCNVLHLLRSSCPENKSLFPEIRELTIGEYFL